MISSEKALAAALAPIYLNGQHTYPTIKENLLFHNWLEDQFNSIPVPVSFTPNDFSPEDLMATYENHGILVIPTGHNQSVWGEITNLKFRAVHDWHHISGNCSFDLDGEIKAYKVAAQSAPEAIYWILFSEIVLQASTAIHTGSFPDQKLIK